LNPELRARFLPRFVAVSRSRLSRARTLFEKGDAPSLAMELHALAGEAMMLDLRGIADDARQGEAAARDWGHFGPEPGEAARLRCGTSLERVSGALASLSESSSEP
jgi:HPt (histidine-containing phosphotransfer) domain-containing protein